MAAGIAGGLGSGAMARMVASSAGLKARYEVLLRQSVDGRVGSSYGDLAPQARLSLDLKAEIARREANAGSITRALSRTQSAQTVLGRLSAIAAQFVATANTVGHDKPAQNASAASAARSALSEIGALLNTRSGGEYLFAGSDTDNAPIRDADLKGGGMAARIAAAVGSLASPGADVAGALAETRDAASNPTDAETPFSDHLEGAGATESRRTSVLDDGAALPTGLWASRNAYAAPGDDPAQSWSRNLLRSLMTLAALPAATGGDPAAIEAVAADARAGLQAAVGGLALEQGTLGQTESRLEAARTRHGELATVLRGQVSDIEEVDLASALTAAQAAKTQLEASWRALAALGSMSLSDFLR